MDKCLRVLWNSYLGTHSTKWTRVILSSSEFNYQRFAAPWEACVYTPEVWTCFTFLIKTSKNEISSNIFWDLKWRAIILMLTSWSTITTKTTSSIGLKPSIATLMVIFIYVLITPAAQYVAGTAFHWYSGPQFDNLLTAHEAYPGLKFPEIFWSKINFYWQQKLATVLQHLIIG